MRKGPENPSAYIRSFSYSLYTFMKRKRELGNLLLLGVVYSEEFTPKRGQEYRDRVRCDALENLGYDVYTLDDKHDSNSITSGRHCQANFADCRRMHKLMQEQWGYESFGCIILDYFFSPIGWARERWTDKFFRETLPSFATKNRLKPNGIIWLPNIIAVSEALEKYENMLGKLYVWEFEQDPSQNPLYKATNDCEKELMKMPDMLTNETQVSAEKGYGAFPFYALRRIKQDSTSSEKKSKTSVEQKSTP